jgi:small subunit ribosomal protein S5
MKYWFERPTLVHRDGKTPVPLSATGNSNLAPALPNRISGVTEEYQRQADTVDDGLDEAGEYQELKQRTGLKVSEMTGLAAKVLVVRFVHNQTRLGKVRSSSVVAIAGNTKGRLGLGIAKSTEFTIAVSKAKAMAIRTMRPVPRYENRTIYGNVEAKISGTVVQLFARPPGGIPLPFLCFLIRISC